MTSILLQPTYKVNEILQMFLASKGICYVKWLHLKDLQDFPNADSADT